MHQRFPLVRKSGRQIVAISQSKNQNRFPHIHDSLFTYFIDSITSIPGNNLELQSTFRTRTSWRPALPISCNPTKQSKFMECKNSPWHIKAYYRNQGEQRGVRTTARLLLLPTKWDLLQVSTSSYFLLNMKTNGNNDNLIAPSNEPTTLVQAAGNLPIECELTRTQSGYILLASWSVCLCVPPSARAAHYTLFVHHIAQSFYAVRRVTMHNCLDRSSTMTPDIFPYASNHVTISSTDVLQHPFIKLDDKCLRYLVIHDVRWIIFTMYMVRIGDIVVWELNMGGLKCQNSRGTYATWWLGSWPAIWAHSTIEHKACLGDQVNRRSQSHLCLTDPTQEFLRPLLSAGLSFWIGIGAQHWFTLDPGHPLHLP